MGCRSFACHANRARRGTKADNAKKRTLGTACNSQSRYIGVRPTQLTEGQPWRNMALSLDSCGKSNDKVRCPHPRSYQKLMRQKHYERKDSCGKSLGNTLFSWKSYSAYAGPAGFGCGSRGYSSLPLPGLLAGKTRLWS